MTIRTPLALFAVAAGLVAVLGCQRPAELRVPLDYRPTDRLTLTGFGVPSSLRLAVTAKDERTEAGAIGRNTEGTPPVPIYSTEPTPDMFVRDAVARELANAGVTIETEPRQATKTLGLRLLHFWVDETNTYKGSIVVDAQLVDASGRRLWGGEVSGNGERFGRSLSAENYQETLSDAAVALVQQLLQSPPFVEALAAAPATSRRR